MAEMTVWRPFADFGELRHRADQLFREMGLGSEGSWAPSLPQAEQKQAVEIETKAKGE